MLKTNPKVTYEQARELLKSGQVVAVPTETVYGLAACIDNEQALSQIFHIKKRPSFDPLIVHCYDSLQAKKYVEGDTELLESLWQHFSPGPLTLIANKNKNINPIITSHKDTVALRIPSHPLMRRLLKDLDVPLAAPSANMYSQLSPTQASDVISSFKGQVPVLDGGECEVGLESTIIHPDLSNQTLHILRPGMITQEDLQKFLNDQDLNLSLSNKSSPLHPGGQSKHYQPEVPLFIVIGSSDQEEILSFLKSKYPNQNLQELILDSSPQIASRFLYTNLRKLSHDKQGCIFVRRTKDQEGQNWNAIWNRLEKASSQIFNLK